MSQAGGGPPGNPEELGLHDWTELGTDGFLGPVTGQGRGESRAAPFSSGLEPEG